MNLNRPGLFLLALATLQFIAADDSSPPTGLKPVVELEENVYQYEPADNGAGPLWCNGSTCLVVAGAEVFASGLETLPGIKPLNNCRWTLHRRSAKGWELIAADENGRTREPAPLASFRDGAIFLSANPTLAAVNVYSGPARPEILQFDAAHIENGFQTILPRWDGEPQFTEHSYRSFVADGANRELLLLQNIGYTHAEWTFRDSSGTWAAQGKLHWPAADERDPRHPLRLCYPDVALHNHAVHFCGVGDIVEPNPDWRAFKKQLTGQEWDYVFRRLFYCWAPDIRNGKFEQWVELANFEKTAGAVSAGDLWVAHDGAAHLVWTQRRIDDRLRQRFFPGEKQRTSIEYAVVQKGKVIAQRTLATADDGRGSLGRARFHATPDHRLWVFYYSNQIPGGAGAENKMIEVFPRADRPALTVPLKHPMSDFFTATTRAGSAPSRTLHLLGQRVNQPRTISYARIRLAD